jgi:hypothetical protein
MFSFNSFGSLDLYLFFNYELLVVICFFFFLFFVLLSENGQLSSFFLDLSLERKSLLSRHLSHRLFLLRDLLFFLVSSATQLRKIFFSYDHSSLDLLFSLQFSVKKFSLFLLSSHIRSYLDTLSLRTHFLSFHIKKYLTHYLFSTRSFSFSLPSSSTFLLIPRS